MKLVVLSVIGLIIFNICVMIYINQYFKPKQIKHLSRSDLQNFKIEEISKNKKKSYKQQLQDKVPYNYGEFGGTIVRLNEQSKLGYDIIWGFDAPVGHQAKEQLKLKLILLQLARNQKDWNPSQYEDLNELENRKGYSLYIKRNNDYCLNSDLYHLIHPNNVKKRHIQVTHGIDEKHALAQFAGLPIGVPQYAQEIGKSAFPKEVSFQPKASIHFTPSITNTYFKPGTQFFCAFQMIDRVIGHFSIVRKYNLVQREMQYRQKYQKAGKEHCYKMDILPKTYSMLDQKQCTEFFEIINSNQYMQNKKKVKVQYVQKKQTAHVGKGVILLDEKNEQKIRKYYQNGKKCGQTKEQEVVQYYINNPLLINKHKFDLRIYVVIVSVKPLIVYYHDGYLRLSISKYNPKNLNDTAAHISNQKHDTLNEKQADELLWNLDQFQQYLLKNNLTKNKKWVDEVLKKTFMQTFTHIIRMGMDTFLKDPGTFHILGGDFLIDQNLKIWFIEINSGAGMKTPNDVTRKIKRGMVKETFNLLFHMLERRTKKIMEFIDSKAQQYANNTEITEGYFNQINLNQLRNEYEQLSYNELNKTFEKNTVKELVKLIDLTDQNHPYFFGIPKECYSI